MFTCWGGDPGGTRRGRPVMERVGGRVGEVSHKSIWKAGMENGEDMGAWARTILRCKRDIGIGR